MLPTATPMKMDAEVSIFLVVPPTLPDTRERASTKTALEEPVRSFVGISPVIRPRTCGTCDLTHSNR
jgi:hypothetical protein